MIHAHSITADNSEEKNQIFVAQVKENEFYFRCFGSSKLPKSVTELSNIFES